MNDEIKWEICYYYVGDLNTHSYTVQTSGLFMWVFNSGLKYNKSGLNSLMKSPWLNSIMKRPQVCAVYYSDRIKYISSKNKFMASGSESIAVWIPLIVGLAPGLVYWIAITAIKKK